MQIYFHQIHSSLKGLENEYEASEYTGKGNKLLTWNIYLVLLADAQTVT